MASAPRGESGAVNGVMCDSLKREVESDSGKWVRAARAGNPGESTDRRTVQRFKRPSLLPYLANTFEQPP